MELNASKVSMITVFISVAGIVFELYNHNWAGALWALWGAFLALMWFSTATVLEDGL